MSSGNLRKKKSGNQSWNLCTIFLYTPCQSSGARRTFIIGRYYGNVGRPTVTVIEGTLRVLGKLVKLPCSFHQLRNSICYNCWAPSATVRLKCMGG
eukprot:4802813-Pyramimonas_sp.AAC.1